MPKILNILSIRTAGSGFHYLITSMASDLRDPTGRLTAEFNRLDRYGDGTLSSDELFEGLRLKYEQDVISEIFDKLDQNGDDNISLDEYLDYWFQQWQKGGVDPRFGVNPKF